MTLSPVRAQTSITVERPIEDVFAVLSDVEKTAMWHPSTVEERWIDADGPAIGARRVAVARTLGFRSENVAVVTAYEPFGRLGLASVDSPVPFAIEISLEPQGSATNVEWLVEMRARRPWMGKLALRAFVRQLDRGLETFRRMMESGEL